MSFSLPQLAMFLLFIHLNVWNCVFQVSESQNGFQQCSYKLSERAWEEIQDLREAAEEEGEDMTRAIKWIKIWDSQICISSKQY